MMVMDKKKAGVCLAQLITGGNANRLKELNCKRNNDPSLIRYIDERVQFPPSKHIRTKREHHLYSAHSLDILAFFLLGLSKECSLVLWLFCMQSPLDKGKGMINCNKRQLFETFISSTGHKSLNKAGRLSFFHSWGNMIYR